MHNLSILSSVTSPLTFLEVFLVVINCKNYHWKYSSSLNSAHLYTGPTQFATLPVVSCSFPVQVAEQYRKLTAFSSFPMHYSLITLLWEAVESALLREIFINCTHLYHKRCDRIDYYSCDRIIGNDVGRACDTQGIKHLQGFGGEIGRKEPVLMT
jgi:hypothetical protein